MHTIKTVLQYRKSTKGKHVFSAEDEGCSIGTLFIAKHAMPRNPPQEVTVTVQGGDQMTAIIEAGANIE